MTIVEGLADFSCSGRSVATVGMATYCSKCKREGRIVAMGYRLNMPTTNGQQVALSGDLNLCGCRPAPVLHVERHAFQDVPDHVGQRFGLTLSVPPQDADESGASNPSRSSPRRFEHWFCAMDHETGEALPHRDYVVMVDGMTQSGTTDAEGRACITTDQEQIGDLHVMFAAPRRPLDKPRGNA